MSTSQSDDTTNTSSSRTLLRHLSDNDPKKWEIIRQNAVQALLAGDREKFNMIITACPEQLRKSLHDAAVSIANEKGVKVVSYLTEHTTDLASLPQHIIDKRPYQPLYKNVVGISEEHDVESIIEPAFLLRMR